MHHLHLRIHGHVQGVGFRHFIRIQATRLGLSGTVRNLPDGSVEVMAEGEHDALSRLLDDARVGPHGAAVTDVTVEWTQGPPRYSHFGIDH
jgi:acylphosphatase